MCDMTRVFVCVRFLKCVGSVFLIPCVCVRTVRVCMPVCCVCVRLCVCCVVRVCTPVCLRALMCVYVRACVSVSIGKNKFVHSRYRIYIETDTLKRNIHRCPHLLLRLQNDHLIGMFMHVCMSV